MYLWYFFPLYNLFSFIISIFLYHKLHFVNNSETITWNRLVSGLVLVQLIQYFWCVHHHTKNCTHNFFYIFLCLFHLSILRSHNIDCYINFWNNNVEQSGKWLFPVRLKIGFQSVHHHKKVVLIIFCFHLQCHLF